MSRLRLPDLRALGIGAGAEVPPLPTPAGAVLVLLSRRRFLQAAAAAGVVASLPWVRVERAWAVRRGRFLVARERSSLAALADTILPRDDTPSASELGVVDYVEQLLTAFDHHVPRIYAGGPFSGRNPFIDYADGAPSRRRPRNRFRHFVPPTRLQSLYWRWQILGTSGLSAGEQTLVAPLDAQLGGPLIGLRDAYRTGLQQLDALARARHGASLDALDDAARADVRDEAARSFPVDPRRGVSFVGLVTRHTLEAAFAAPEYGGNRHGAGWAMLGLEGDSQPLGYDLFSRADGTDHERADHPLSTPNPDEVAAPRALSSEADAVQAFIVATTSALPEAC